MSTKCWDIRNKDDKVYSVNLVKGESQWGLPVSNDEVGWEKNQSRKEPSKIYYRNIKTRDYQWDKPEPKKEPLEENWEERKSRQCDQIYYINTKENISKWSHPNESVTKLKSSLKKDTSQKENARKARDLKEQEEKRQKDLIELNERRARELKEQEEKRKIALIEQDQRNKKSDKAEKQDELWPMDKMHKMLNSMEFLKGIETKKYAVLLTTGAMNPVHKGHISLITQARQRIYEDGYEVMGAWLSPSHDIYLRQKAKRLNTIALSAAFRVKATQLSVSNDPVIDVGLWESSLKLSGSNWEPSDYPFVCLALKAQIEKEFESKYGEITVFYVCGADHARNNQLYKKQPVWGGVVVVPREGEETEEENPSIKVYVAKRSYDDTEKFSSTLIRKAIAENNTHIVRKMMSVRAARFLLEPTDEEYTKFSADFDKLKPKKPVLLTKKEQLIDNNFQIPWIQTNGKFILNNLNYKKSRAGNYVFDPSTLQLITNVNGSFVQTTTVMYTKCMVSAKEFKETSESIKPKITPIIGKIQTEIQKPSKRHKIFVLPSQLNAAEYVTDDTIITDVDFYKFDKTGGPMGQLSADPSVAQFIIDNACNQMRPDKGINNVRLMGNINGIRLHNGYLKVKDTVDVEAFKRAIPNMTILGIKDIPVRGLDSKMENFVNMDHKVDLIYASAVPYGNLETGELTYGNSTHKNVRTIAKLSLFAQYVGSMRLAISRGNCDLILMPLGGGAFKNAYKDIKSAIISAYNYMEKELNTSNVNVFLLLYDGNINKDEINFFTK
jgi:hypothetical protein